MTGSASLRSQTFPAQIGVEAGPDRVTGFIDAFKDQGRLFLTSNLSTSAPTDSNGWPTTDGVAVVFDNRPVPAWAPPIDDPAQYQPNCSGTYIVSFNGTATLSSVSPNPTLTFSGQTYDAATNTTTVNVYLPGGPTYSDGAALMVIRFANTQRTGPGDHSTGDGVTNLQVIRPGFTLAQAATQVFDPAFLNALAPFSFLRFMTWLGTNTLPFYMAGQTPLLAWSQRSLPTDAYQGVGSAIQSVYPARAGAWGISWEYVILLANAANKDIWINVPISATGGSDPLDPTYVASPDTSSYIYNLAVLLKNGNAFTGNHGLNPGLHIYLEHSNEVWNSAFGQNGWNHNAANAEVAKGGSVLNNDKSTDSNAWAARRHIKRLYEIAQIFQSVFGAGSLNNIVRPVYAWWQLDEGSGSYGSNALAWFMKTYGPPSNYFYAMAQGDYFANSNYAADTTIDKVLQDMQTGSQGSASAIPLVQKSLSTAQQYGLPLYAYEGGPSNNNGGSSNTTNIGVEIQANRQKAASDDIGLGMDLLVENHVRNNWFGYGGSNFGYFQLSSAYSRYGSWGLTDDYCNLQTAKYSAILNLTGYTPTAPAVPQNVNANAASQTVVLTWPALAGASNYTVQRAQSAGGPYTTLGTACTPGYTDLAVTNGIPYYYEVTAVNASGQSGAPSNPLMVTPGVTAAAPGAPTGLTATAGFGEVQLSWTAPATGGAVVSYQVWSAATGLSYAEVKSGLAGTSFTVSDLTADQAYSFYVTASNSAGASSPSNTATATPLRRLIRRR
jgi:hypothetical protein